MDKRETAIAIDMVRVFALRACSSRWRTYVIHPSRYFVPDMLIE